MKVFISWSGNLSKAVAEILKEWIKCVLQASKPWISSQDIDKGSLWFDKIKNALEGTSIGIVCLTKSNKDRPWILFEAGSLAKGLSSNRVCTFLINLQPSEIKDPLAQFNHTMPRKDDLRKLVGAINNELGENKLEENILNTVFDTYWPNFESKFNRAIEDNSEEGQTDETRPDDDMLAEILNITRNLDRRMRAVEQNTIIHNDDSESRSSFENYAAKMLDRLQELDAVEHRTPVQLSAAGGLGLVPSPKMKRMRKAIDPAS